MLDYLRSWAKGLFASKRPETPQQSLDGARVKREARAHTVTDLQTRVRALQQQITDLTAADENASLETNRAKLAQLEAQLAETQEELARYQGRI